jgi:hypothetical protein
MTGNLRKKISEGRKEEKDNVQKSLSLEFEILP